MDQFPIIDRLGSASPVRDRGQETSQQRTQLRNRKPRPSDDETPDDAESADGQEQHQLDELA
jgi:hypothetical protein